MKKILSFLTAGLLALTMFSCSTDLHDVQPIKHEPVTIAGAKWYYYDLTVFGDNAGKAKFIVNNNGKDVQTVDTTLGDFSAKNGGALYYTVDATAATKTLACNISYQNDNPSYTAVPGVLRIYVYSNITEPTLHIWDNDDAFKGTSWPGYSFTENGKTAVATYDAKCQLVKVTVTNIPAAFEGADMYLVGAFNGWGDGFKDANKATVTSSKISLSYSTPVEISAKAVEVGKVGTSDLKFATNDWKKAITTPTAANGNFSMSVLNGKKIALVGVCNTEFADGEYKRAGCDWSIQVIGDIE